MKVIMVMFDSLNRHMLPPYGCDWTHAPNFQRLAQRSVTFDRSYICSMPCMPARRDLHTARPNFLHRAWGPLEPFDDSVPEMLKDAGVYTHLVSDHYHYWEDGGCTYHTRYTTWDCVRGQEGDPWIGQVADPAWPNAIGRNASHESKVRQDLVNRATIEQAASHPQARTFAAGMDFIRRNAAADRWMLHLETFDPHEPFFAHAQFRQLYPHDKTAPLFDWPPYARVRESHDQVEQCKYEYASLLSMCDHHLGQLLDLMDELDLWRDTMLLVWTDHGYLLGEHDYWAKMRMPWYEELAHTPFFAWDPRSGNRGERRQALVQPSLDIGPTLLEFFGLQPTGDMVGKSLRNTIGSDASVREAAIFGVHGGQVNVTDGRYVYMRATHAPAQLYEYTLMPTRMNRRFTCAELEHVELSAPQVWAKGCRMLKIPCPSHDPARGEGWFLDEVRQTWLFDVQNDPGQQQPLKDPAVEKRMLEHMARLMRQCDAPPEQFERLALGRVAL